MKLCAHGLASAPPNPREVRQCGPIKMSEPCKTPQLHQEGPQAPSVPRNVGCLLARSSTADARPGASVGPTTDLGCNGRALCPSRAYTVTDLTTRLYESRARHPRRRLAALKIRDTPIPAAQVRRSRCIEPGGPGLGSRARQGRPEGRSGFPQCHASQAAAAKNTRLQDALFCEWGFRGSPNRTGAPALWCASSTSAAAHPAGCADLPSVEDLYTRRDPGTPWEAPGEFDVRRRFVGRNIRNCPGRVWGLWQGGGRPRAHVLVRRLALRVRTVHGLVLHNSNNTGF